MDAVVDDEKKAFDAETAQDDDSQPDPEEHLMLDQGNGRIWLVKVRKSITVVLQL
jgi:transcription initiation factor TFIIF subunit beta